MGETIHQAFGGICMNRTDYIKEILDVFDVSCWEDLKGQYARIVRDDEGNIIKIGHIINDEWFEYKKKEFDFYMDLSEMKEFLEFFNKFGNDSYPLMNDLYDRIILKIGDL